VLYSQTEQTQRNVVRSMAVSAAVVVAFGLLKDGPFGRLSSFYDVPNSVALFVAPLIVYLIWEGEVLTYLLAAFLLAGLVATQSVGGIVAVLLALFIGLLWWRRNRFSVPAITYTFVALCLIAGYFTMTGRVLYLLQTFSAPAHTSWNVRLQLWSSGTTLIAHHPLLGVGLGQFEGAYQAVLHQRFYDYEQLKTSTHEPLREFVFRDPHNFILSFWLNTGLLGLLGWLATSGAAIAATLKKSWPPTRLQQSLLLALLAMLLFGLVDTVYWKNDLATQWWLLVLLLAWAGSETAPPS
jgi:putative inorganic carbon (HCO3(-)) transporter